MIKRVLTFVSGVQESVFVDFTSQNKVKILHEVETCQNCFCCNSIMMLFLWPEILIFNKIVFIKNFLTKTNKFI